MSKREGLMVAAILGLMVHAGLTEWRIRALQRDFAYGAETTFQGAQALKRVDDNVNRLCDAFNDYLDRVEGRH